MAPSEGFKYGYEYKLQESEGIMIGLIILAIIVILFFLGYVGILSVIGAIIFMFGTLGALIYDEIYDKIKRIAFIIIALFGVALIIFDMI